MSAPTLAAYNPEWTDAVAVLTEVSPPELTPVVKRANGTIAVFDATKAYTLVTPRSATPTAQLVDLFTHSTGMPLSATVLGASIWWVVQPSQLQVYEWNGTTVTLRYTTTDATGAAVIFSSSTNIYLAYSVSGGVRIRRYDAGAWTVLATNTSYSTIQGGAFISPYWYVTAYRFNGEAGDALAVLTDNPSVAFTPQRTLYSTPPVGFNSKVYTAFSASNLVVGTTLFEINPANGNVSYYDVSAIITGFLNGVMAALNGSLYIGFISGGPSLFKSAGTTVGTWTEVLT